MGLSNRRSFMQFAGAALASTALPMVSQIQTGKARSSTVPRLGTVVKVKAGGSSEEVVKHVHDLGFPTCQIFFEELDMKEARPLMLALQRYGVQVSALSEHNPGPRVFDFYGGPLTVGLLPEEHRGARIDALKLAADFAQVCDIPSIHTHLGFIPEDPNDPLYPVIIEAIKEVAWHCKKQGRMLLCETGEETPITMLRMIQDVGTGNVFVNLDTANLILYGKGNPVDAMDVFGHLVRGMHAKDGLFPTNPHTLGEEVAIGHGRVDFPTLFKKLKEVHYERTVTIEREISGPRQIEDILQSKSYLQHLIDVNFA
jgi:L-ribulose-5-phosphate 3-epimerase